MAKKKEFQVTIGYKAVVVVTIYSETETDAKEKALKIFTDTKTKMYNKSNLELQDDSFNAHGVLDMDETWNIL